VKQLNLAKHMQERKDRTRLISLMRYHVVVVLYRWIVCVAFTLVHLSMLASPNLLLMFIV
jgi:hypothetical protein